MKRIFTFVLAVMLVLPFIFVPALAAPIGGGVTESSGDGYALYNGVKLPNIDTVWTDKHTYPYAFVVVGKRPGTFELFCCNEPFVWNGDGITASNVRISRYAGAPSVSFWQALDKNVVWDQSYSVSLLWSSYDFSNIDGSVYLSSSSPISLDGMTVIEWDGTVSSHNYLSDHLWRVSDLTPSINQLAGGFSVLKSVATGNLTVVTLNVGSTLSQEDGYIYFTGGGVYPNANSPGIYFTFNDSDSFDEQVQTQLLAFSATEGGGGGVQPDPSVPTDPTLPDDPTDPTLSLGDKLDKIDKNQGITNDKLDKIDKNQGITNDKLDKIDKNQGITNDKLDKIDKNQGITNDKLDHIIDGSVAPNIPNGGNIIADNDDLESQIKDHITPSIDSIGDWFTDSLEIFKEYSGVFLIIIWLFDKIVDIGFFKPLLAISLSLGVVCSILGIGMTLANKSKRGD